MPTYRLKCHRLTWRDSITLQHQKGTIVLDRFFFTGGWALGVRGYQEQVFIRDPDHRLKQADFTPTAIYHFSSQHRHKKARRKKEGVWQAEGREFYAIIMRPGCLYLMVKERRIELHHMLPA